MVILLVLLLALLLGGLGFAIDVLWWIALVVLVIWLIGFVVRIGDRSAWPRASLLKGPDPVERILRGDHAELEPPVVRPRLGEGLDSAENRAGVPGEHARYPALEKR
jgi:hypothetical protein